MTTVLDEKLPKISCREQADLSPKWCYLWAMSDLRSCVLSQTWGILQIPGASEALFFKKPYKWTEQ